MTLVSNKNAPTIRRRKGHPAGGGVTGGDQDITVDGAVPIAVSESSDVSVGHPPPQPLVPLLHQDTRRDDHEREEASLDRVLDRCQGYIGLP